MGHTYSQPLGVIFGRGGEESRERVVARDDEASKVGEELAAEVEDDHEEVKSAEANGGVGLGNARGLLDGVEGGILGQLISRRIGGQQKRIAQCSARAVRRLPAAIGRGHMRRSSGEKMRAAGLGRHTSWSSVDK